MSKPESTNSVTECSDNSNAFPLEFVVHNVHAFLKWNPPKLQPRILSPSGTKGLSHLKKGKTPKVGSAGLAKGTRAPAFYDLHLAEYLRLDRLQSLPTLVDSIADIVDRSIQSIYASGRPLPSRPGRLYSEDDLVRQAGDLSKYMEGEERVLENYQLRVATHALPIASTLLLHPGSDFWDSRIIEWTRAPSLDAGRHAIADGFLKFGYQGPGFPDMFPSHIQLEPHIKAMFSELEDRTLATWEMKSLAVGSKDVMDTIYQRALRKEKFAWKKCEARCDRDDHEDMFNQEVDGHRGVDPLNPPWQWPDSDDDQPPTGLRRSKRLVNTKALNYCETSPKSEDSDSPGTTASNQRKNKVKAPEDLDPDHPDTRGGKRYVTSNALLQQAWAQAVRYNSTVIVLHAGNHEILGVRHRARQTLYVSPVIEPHAAEPAYGRIQVGIYITAILETLDRIHQEKEKEKEMADLSSTGQKPHDKGRDDGGSERDDDEVDLFRKRASLNKSQPSKGPDAHGETRTNLKTSESRGKTQAANVSGNVDLDEVVSNAALSRNIAYVHLLYGIYASPAPAVFIRKQSQADLQPTSPPPSLTQGGNDINDRYANSIDIILTSEKNPGSTGIVHLGRMNVEPHAINIPVAAKLGFRYYDKGTLEHERRIYDHLQSKGVMGIPHCFGLFVYDGEIEDSEGPHALVMSFAGKSLHGQMENASLIARKSFLSTLKAIHRAGVVHGDIRLANLCVNQYGQAIIIDFSHSEISSSLSRMHCEIAELCEILNLSESDSNVKLPKVNSEAGLQLGHSARIKEKRVVKRRRTAAAQA